MLAAKSRPRTAEKHQCLTKDFAIGPQATQGWKIEPERVVELAEAHEVLFLPLLTEFCAPWMRRQEDGYVHLMAMTLCGYPLPSLHARSFHSEDWMTRLEVTWTDKHFKELEPVKYELTNGGNTVRHPAFLVSRHSVRVLTSGNNEVKIAAHIKAPDEASDWFPHVKFITNRRRKRDDPMDDEWEECVPEEDPACSVKCSAAGTVKCTGTSGDVTATVTVEPSA